MARFVLEPFYFIFETQFLTLQVGNLEIVCRWPRLLLFDPTIQCAVLL